MTSPSDRFAELTRLVEAHTVTRVTPPLLLPAAPYFELAGEEFGRNLLLTTTNNGVELCLRPDFTLPIAQSFLADGRAGTPSAYTYLGPIFRQLDAQPVEAQQAGLELLAQPDPELAIDQVLNFIRRVLTIYDIGAIRVRVGGVGLFEAFLEASGVPAAWRGRIRHRFGHPEALARLMERLARPDPGGSAPIPEDRETVVEIVTEAMIAGGLALVGSRTPDEIADRYIEKQALSAAPVPPDVVRLLETYLAIAAPAADAFDQIEALASEHGFSMQPALSRARAHLNALSALAPASDVIFDAGFSPRLDYYTGIVFELLGHDGSILASGGEYDRMLERLGAKAPISACGCAVWVERLERERTR
jgi:ATP phosphoribosyltransferase regulatory subunit